MFSRKRSCAIFLQVALLLMLPVISCSDSGGGTGPPPSPPFPGGLLIERVGINIAGIPANSGSSDISISANGRYIVFRSHATNLTFPDLNAMPDIFVYDREIGTIERVNVATDGTDANDQSGACFISGDGRFVVFDSAASNLIASDLNNKWDIFVADRVSGTIERIVADANVSSISADGWRVAFQSSANNLVSGDINGMSDAFVYDRQTGQVILISVDSDGTQGDGDSYWPHISPAGDHVAFSSVSQNLVSGDTNSLADAFLHDMTLGTTERISISSGGTQGDNRSVAASISADGNIVVFNSNATNMISVGPAQDNIFVRDRAASSTVQISTAFGGGNADAASGGGSISADGRYVVFYSDASNLVAVDGNSRMDVFVHDRITGEMAIVSIAADGTQGNGSSGWASISADGRYIVFESDAINLVPESDFNSAWDVFVAPNPLAPRLIVQ